MYHFVICTSHFLSNARFYRLQTALEKKKKKKKRPQRMNEVVFISIETSNFGHWNFHSREKI